MTIFTETTFRRQPQGGMFADATGPFSWAAVQPYTMLGAPASPSNSLADDLLVRLAGRPGAGTQQGSAPWEITSADVEAAGAAMSAAKEDRVGRRTPDELQTDIGHAEQNAPAAIRETGTYPGPTPNPEQFVALYGATEGLRRFQAFNQAMDVSRQFYGMRGMSNEAVLAMVKESSPRADGATSEQDSARHDAIVTAADLTLKERQGDPGGYVRKTFAKLDAVWNNLSTPQAYQAAIIGSIAAQHQLGFEKIQPLPNSVAGDIVAGLKSGTEAQDDSLNYIFAALPTEAAQKAMLEHLVRTSADQKERRRADRTRRDCIVDPKMLLDLRKAVELGLRGSNVEVTNYIQTPQDKLGQLIARDSKPGSVWRTLARVLVGSEGAGEEGISLLGLTPMIAADKAAASAMDGNYGDTVLNALGAIPAEKLASVGLRQVGKIAEPLVNELSQIFRRPDDLAEGAEAIVRGSSGKLANSTDDVLSEEADLYKGIDDLSNIESELPSGSFSIADWTDYPEMIPKPEGPFRLLEGTEYEEARKAADHANRAVRRKLGLARKLVDVHEIKPVKFGGSPTDISNKIILPRNVHRKQVTPWWEQLRKDLGG